MKTDFKVGDIFKESGHYYILLKIHKITQHFLYVDILNLTYKTGSVLNFASFPLEKIRKVK